MNNLELTHLPYLNDQSLVAEKAVVVNRYFWSLWEEVVQEYLLPKLPFKLSRLWPQEKVAFFLAFCSFRYGNIYFISRSELKLNLFFLKLYSSDINAIFKFIYKEKLFNKIYNLIINRFVFTWSDKCYPVEKMITQNQFQIGKFNNVYYRKGRFFSEIESIISLGDVAFYDLHDFSHVLSTICCPELYGCCYHELPDFVTNKIFRKLISKPKKIKTEIDLYTDGFIYTDLSREIYDQCLKKAYSIDDRNLIRTMALNIFEYLIAKRSLRVKDYKIGCKLNKAIPSYHLLILAINKLYENSASEVERFLFIRSDDISLGSFRVTDCSAMKIGQRP